MFQNVGINFEGNIVHSCNTFLNSVIRKTDNPAVSIITHSYLEDTLLSLHWLTREKAMTVVKCVFNNVSSDISTATRLIDNTIIN